MSRTRCMRGVDCELDSKFFWESLLFFSSSCPQLANLQADSDEKCHTCNFSIWFICSTSNSLQIYLQTWSRRFQEEMPVIGGRVCFRSGAPKGGDATIRTKYQILTRDTFGPKTNSAQNFNYL